jgi:biopolymer transport protein ExbD
MNPKTEKSRTTSDINVTPLIDVMLVLIIIFMVVTPLSNAGLDVGLPTSQGDDDTLPRNEQIVLELNAVGEITINMRPVNRDELPSRIRDIFETRADKTLFLQADNALKYKAVVSVLDILKGNGVERVGLVSR